MVPTMVAEIRVSITVVPVTLVRTVGSIRLAGTSMIILFHLKTNRAKYHNFRDPHHLL